MPWQNINNIGSKQYTCGHCGNIVASKDGFFSDNNQRIYICTHCDNPTHFNALGGQFPDVAPGNDVNHLPCDG